MHDLTGYVIKGAHGRMGWVILQNPFNLENAVFLISYEMLSNAFILWVEIGIRSLYRKHLFV